MTDKPAKNMAASVRQRLLNHSRASGEDYSALLAQYAIERFFVQVVEVGLVRTICTQRRDAVPRVVRRTA